MGATLGAVASMLLASAVPATAAPTEIEWRDLRRGEAVEARADGPVAISGYLLPVDQEGDLVYAFLLVPPVGGCSHTAQPPPDQLVLVRLQEPYRLRRNYEPVSVTGALLEDEVSSQFYFRDGVMHVRSAYRMSAATVAADATADQGPFGGPNPWKRLTR